MSRLEHRQDLHLHKGGESFEQLIRAAKQKGRKTISIPGKESTANMLAAEDACKKQEMSFLRSVEVSCGYDGHVYHFLVYDFKRRQPLIGLFKRGVNYKNERINKTVNRLDRDGWFIDRAVLNKVPKIVRGRRAVVELIRNHPANQDRLLAEEIFTNDDFYQKYLVPGKIAYFVRKVVSVSQLVRAAHKAGGIIIWAHPIRTMRENFGEFDFQGKFKSVFEALNKAGIDGIEVYYPGVSDSEIIGLYNLCRSSHLFVTAGSDSLGCKQTKIPRIIGDMVPDDIKNKGSFYRGVS